MKRTVFLLLITIATNLEALSIGKIANCTYQPNSGSPIIFNENSCDSCLCTAFYMYNVTEIILNCFNNGIRCELFKNYSNVYSMVTRGNSTFYFYPNLPPTTPSTPTVPILRWNTTGIRVAGFAPNISTASNHLYYPYSLAFDSNKSLYIIDYGNHRIQKYLAGVSSGITVAGQSSGSSGSSSTALNNPVGLVFDSADNMYFTDRTNHRVMFWAKGATSGSVIAGSTGVSGTANNRFDGPSCLVRVNSTGTLYIADTFNHRIMQYLANASSGTVVAGGNGPGTNVNQLNLPFGFAFDEKNNSFLIANYGAHNIVRWRLGSTSWTLVAGVTGVSGSLSTQLHAPLSVVLDRFGNMYVADTNNHRIQMFLANENNATTIAGVTGSSGTGAHQFSKPYWAILDEDLNLYVADTFNNRVQKFLSL